MTPPLFGVVGWKNSGKTTLVTRLITAFTAQGLKVAAIKHAHHAFDIDHEGRDSFRYRAAGASTVVVSSAARFALMRELIHEPEPSLSELAKHAVSADIILVEGFKAERHPKIEVRRLQAVSQAPLAPGDPAILAVAADFRVDAGPLPVFDLDAANDIAAFIMRTVGIPQLRIGQE